MRAVFTGGGTGGHVYPALAVAQTLLARPGWQGLYIGTRGRAEERIIQGMGVAGQQELPFRAAMAVGFPGLRSWRMLPFIIRLKLGVMQAAWHLLRFRPQVVVATGGYAAAPTVLAAAILRKLRLLKCGILIHEQNASVGLMNRLSGRMADLVALTFEESAEALPGCRTLLVGYPVRAGLERLSDRGAACVELGLDPDRPILFVFGGSQGARAINRALYHILPELLRRGMQVLHGTGMSAGTAWDATAEHTRQLADLQRRTPDWSALAPLYHARPYFDRIQLAYAAADLVCCRAGAGAIFELMVLGRPALLVPKSGLPGDHQTANARSAQRAGVAELLLEEPIDEDGGIGVGLRPERMLEEITALLGDRERLERMALAASNLHQADARERLAVLAEDLAHGHPLPAGVRAGGGSRVVALERRGTADLLVGIAGLGPRDRRYVEYRCLAALCSGLWTERNAGIKLAMALGLADALPLLVRIAEDATPPGLLPRLLGEKRRQNGFIRRNVMQAFARLPLTPDVSRVLRGALADPYWEVRVAAIHTLAALSDKTDEALVRRMAEFRDQGNFEEAQAVADWWSVCMPAESWRQWALPLSRNANCMVRESAIRALQRRVREGNLELVELKGEMDGFLITSTHFRPRFPLKQAMRSLAEQREEGGPC